MVESKVNPWLQRWFNLTAGLEKAIIAIAAAFQVWVGSFPEADILNDAGEVIRQGWTAADKALVIALIGVVQIIYTANTAAVPPTIDPAPEEPLVAPEIGPEIKP